MQIGLPGPLLFQTRQVHGGLLTADDFQQQLCSLRVFSFFRFREEKIQIIRRDQPAGTEIPQKPRIFQRGVPEPERVFPKKRTGQAGLFRNGILCGIRNKCPDSEHQELFRHLREHTGIQTLQCFRRYRCLQPFRAPMNPEALHPEKRAGFRPGQAGRERELCQSRAPFKSSFSDADKAFLKIHSFENSAPEERAAPDFLKPLGERNAPERHAAAEGGISDFRKPRRQRDFRQRLTVLKSAFGKIRKTCRQIRACKGRAASERSSAESGQSRREPYFAQCPAVDERTFPDLSKPFRE